jgi:hypothetical protein
MNVYAGAGNIANGSISSGRLREDRITSGKISTGEYFQSNPRENI